MQITELLPTVQQTARRSTPEELVASGQATLPQRSEPQISVKSSRTQPQSGGSDTSGPQEGTSVKLQKRYKLSVGAKRAQVKRRPKGDHAGAEIGRGKEEEPQKPPPVREEDPLTPSDRMLLEVGRHAFTVSMAEWVLLLNHLFTESGVVTRILSLLVNEVVLFSGRGNVLSKWH